MWVLLVVASAWAAVFDGPVEVRVGSEDVVVAWRNVDVGAVTVTGVHVDDAATLQVVPPHLPKTVEPGKAFKMLIVADGTLAPGFVTVETSAGPARLWVDVSRAYVPVVAGGGKKPGVAAGAGAGPSSGGFAGAGTISGGAEPAAKGGGTAGFGRPEPTLQVTGPMDSAVVERVLLWRREALAVCADATVQDLAATFRVETTGHVSSAAVEGGAAGPCVEGVLRDTVFPTPDAPVAVRWVFPLGS